MPVTSVKIFGGARSGQVSKFKNYRRRKARIATATTPSMKGGHTLTAGKSVRAKKVTPIEKDPVLKITKESPSSHINPNFAHGGSPTALSQEQRDKASEYQKTVTTKVTKEKMAKPMKKSIKESIFGRRSVMRKAKHS